MSTNMTVENGIYITVYIPTELQLDTIIYMLILLHLIVMHLLEYMLWPVLLQGTCIILNRYILQRFTM
jgi:hypothetical protein